MDNKILLSRNFSVVLNVNSTALLPDVSWHTLFLDIVHFFQLICSHISSYSSYSEILNFTFRLRQEEVWLLLCIPPRGYRKLHCVYPRWACREKHSMASNICWVLVKLASQFAFIQLRRGFSTWARNQRQLPSPAGNHWRMRMLLWDSFSLSWK